MLFSYVIQRQKIKLNYLKLVMSRQMYNFFAYKKTNLTNIYIAKGRNV